METLVRLDGAVELIVRRLLDLGYFKTRSEVIRAGVLGLGKEFQLVTPKQLEDELVVRKMQKMRQELKSGKVKAIPLDDVLKEFGIKKSDLR